MVRLTRSHPAALASPDAPAPWRWVLAGAVSGMLISTTLYAPAHWLNRAVGWATGERVVLREAQGSIWTGSSQLLLTGGQGSTDAVRLPGRIHWELHPLLGGVRLDLHADCCMATPAQIRVRWLRWNGVQIEMADHRSDWPADLLTGLGTPWNTIQVRGQLTATTQGMQLQWAPGQFLLQGQMLLDAHNITSRLSTLAPMGSYRLTMAGGTQPSLQLQTLSGSLQLEGQGQWVGARLRFSGVASAAPERVEALSNLLNIVGRRDGARSLITLGS